MNTVRLVGNNVIVREVCITDSLELLFIEKRTLSGKSGIRCISQRIR
jgi:hypothetical protein